MLVYGQNSCTLSTITDVKAIYTYHCLISGTYNPGMAPNDNTSPLNSSNQVKDSITITYNSNTYTWTLTEPGLDITNIDLNKLYYIDCVIFSNNTYDWGPPLVSSSYEAAKQAYNKADIASGLVGNMNQYFWSLTSPYSTDIPAGQYITDDSQTSFKENPSGKSNLLLQSAGISLRYGAVTKAQVTSNGLKVIEGGIEGGSASSGNGYVYLSTIDKTGVTINGHAPDTNDPKWRAIIGSKFGVDSEGNLYASNANISGAITATSLIINAGANVSGLSTSNISGMSNYASSDAEYSVEIIPSNINYTGIAYEETSDETYDSTKTYYTYDSSTHLYSEFSGDSFVSGTTYYEISANVGTCTLTANVYKLGVLQSSGITYSWSQDSSNAIVNGNIDGNIVYNAYLGSVYKVEIA